MNNTPAGPRKKWYTDEDESDTQREDSPEWPLSARGRSRYPTSTPSTQGTRQTKKSRKTSQTREKFKRPSSRGRTTHHTRTPSPQDWGKNSSQKTSENRNKPYRRQPKETSPQGSSRDPSRSRYSRRASPSWDRTSRRNRTPSPAGSYWYDTSQEALTDTRQADIDDRSVLVAVS